MNRRAAFIVAIVVSAVLHALLLYFAPRIAVLRSSSEPPKVLQRVSVNLEEFLAPRVEARATDTARATEDAVANMLARQEEAIAPASIERRPMAPVEERLEESSAPPERQPVPPPDAHVLSKMDAKILEISQETAREDIAIARRAARPIANRIVPEGANPTLRSPLEGPSDEVLLVDPLAADGPAMDAPASAPAPPGPSRGDAEMLSPIEAAFEQLTASAAPREAIQQEIEAERDYDYIDDLLQLSLETYAPSRDEPGYFRLRIMPRDDAPLEVMPKDVTFVIDASKSIVQPKLNETVDGVAAAIGRLRPEDRFDVVYFRDHPSALFGEFTPATAAAKAEAELLLEQLESRGETDVYRGIAPVLSMPGRVDAARLVVIATDGRPTTGMREGREVIHALTRTNESGGGVYAFAGGRTVNRYLLELLAYRNRGEAHIIDNLNDIEEALPQFFARYDDPILKDLSANYSRVIEREIYPRELPDFFRGRAVTVYGRYEVNSDGEFAVRLTGAASDERKEVIFRADLDASHSGDAAIARQWAFHKAYAIIGQMTEEGETAALREELRLLSQRYGFRTSYDE